MAFFRCVSCQIFRLVTLRFLPVNPSTPISTATVVQRTTVVKAIRQVTTPCFPAKLALQENKAVLQRLITLRFQEIYFLYSPPTALS